MTTRQTLHQLLDELPDDLLAIAEARIVALRDDPFLRFQMTAPEVDEPLDEEDLAALAEADAEIARGETIPWEEAERRLFPAE